MTRKGHPNGTFGLKFTQEIHDLRLAPFHRADEFAAHDAIAIDDVGLGPFEAAVEGARLLIRVAHGYEVDFVILQEFVIGVAVNVNTHSNNTYALILKALLQLHQGRHFFDTRRAPCRPKVQDYDLSVKVPERDRAVRVLDGEVRRSGADARRTGAAIAAGQKKRKKGEKNRRASHRAYNIRFGI